MPTNPGTRLGPYEILAPLGSGGMGEVYRARDTRLGREVALKILPPERLADPQRRARFLQEARAASALTHPHIVTVHDVGEQDGVLYLAMELVDGETLERKLAAGPLAPSDALRLAAQAAGGLARAHETGLVHRDLKPANIMVTRSGDAKLLDFGLAKLMADAPAEDEATRTMAAVTEQGAVMGTVAYMPPEQAQAKPVDARSDTFSFGSVLYEMLTGRRAFSGENTAATMAAILRDDPPPTTLPRAIDRIVRRCLRKDPARRYQSMADLQNALDEAREDLESGRSSVMATAAAEAASPSRRPWALIAVALAGLLLGAAGVWWWRPATAASPMHIPSGLLTMEARVQRRRSRLMAS